MKYTAPIVMLAVFEAIAVTLWLTKDNIFYLLNFSYIGCSIALGIFLYIKNYKYARPAACRTLYADLPRPDLTRKYADRGLLVLSIFRRLRGSNDSLRSGKDIRTSPLRTGMVRIRMLDGDGTGFSSI